VKKKAILASSGGLDSGVLLHQLLKQDREVLAVQFQYGSKHNRWELEAQMALTMFFRGQNLPVRHLEVDLTTAFAAFKSTLLNSGGDLPAGHYEEESMRQTVVPGRNLIFASVLAGLAESNDIPELYLGVHAGDHFIYPDCRPEFINSLTYTVRTSSGGKVMVLAPLLHKTKKEIVKIGLDDEFPFQLTRTCYSPNEEACGVCGSCQERLEAFALNDAMDPIPYESRVLLPKSR
jgi:7-cyano-7-deazaguanine synthase